MPVSNDDGGVAFATSRDGTIVRIIRNELTLSKPILPGTNIVELVDEASAAQALAFLAVLNERHAAFDWELTMNVAGQPTPMHFGGTVEEGFLVVVVARNRGELSRVSGELAGIDSEHTNARPAAYKERSPEDLQANLRDSRLYEDLSRLNNELASLQREMVRKNAELERLNELKNRMIGMAAHDLRSPLSVILSYSEFLAEDAAEVPTPAQREFVAVISSTSQFMLRMVTDLLDVTAIEAGQLRLDRQPTDLVALVRHNLTLNRVLAARKQIAVELDEVAPLPAIPLDAGKIEQVLNNLLTNAVKFSHPGSTVRVRVTCSKVSVTVAVEDQGQGIPASDLPKLFKPFGRGSVRSTAGEDSTGLGLAIARNIVEGHGGRIWLESVVGQGSTFSFMLPTA